MRYGRGTIASLEITVVPSLELKPRHARYLRPLLVLPWKTDYILYEMHTYVDLTQNFKFHYYCIISIVLLSASAYIRYLF
jgi:hypothetical protein